MTFYTRRSTRIPNYDYSSCNYYFVTICTHNRRCIFGSPGKLDQMGKTAEQHILGIESHYEGLRIDKFVVMPNHIHMIIKLDGVMNAPDLSQVIAQYKAGVAREIHKYAPNMKVWQRSFHDHIIRNQRSYEKIWNYIDGNPQCWEKDCFFIDRSVMLNRDRV